MGNNDEPPARGLKEFPTPPVLGGSFFREREWEMTRLERLLGEDVVEAMKMDLANHWKLGVSWSALEAKIRKDGGSWVDHWNAIIAKASSRLKIGEKTTVGIKDAKLEFRPPMPYKTLVGGEILSQDTCWKSMMPYKTLVGGEILSQGTADGFIGIVGEFHINERIIKLVSRQIGKPFYQYVPFSV